MPTVPKCVPTAASDTDTLDLLTDEIPQRSSSQLLGFSESGQNAKSDPPAVTTESHTRHAFPSKLVPDALPPATPSLTLPSATSPPKSSPIVLLSSLDTPSSAILAELPDHSSTIPAATISSFAQLPQR
ncbi:hypothetical protein EI94DRAFT_1798819 [Lactarius quietus]|nr:hypothetical protein EI94DRAFT_1798819 [Lactarius quietus]